MYKPFGTQTMGPKPQYTSGRDMLAKAMERENEMRAAEEQLAKAYPAMEALLKTRMANKTPLVIQRPLMYVANEMVTTYGQRHNPETGWMEDDLDDPRGSYFKDVRKSVEPGTQLILKSLDHNLQEFVFEDQTGEEVAIPYEAKTALMTCTNIYEDVRAFIEQHKIGE